MEKSILVSIIAVFAVLTLVSVVSAGNLTGNWEVTVDGAVVEADGATISGIEAGETIPIKVVFTAEKDASEVRLRAYIDGYRSDISSKTDRFELIEDSLYTRRLTLDVPADIDPTEEYTLIIRISDQADSDEKEYTLKLQRESFNLQVLSAEVPEKATPGSTIAVDVVLKNWGMHDLEDIFVVARIPELGIERKVYFGDLDPQDESEVDIDLREASRHDSVERRIYLTIPDNAKAGIYSLEVETYNVDSANIVKKNIVVSGLGEISDVLSGTGAKTLNIGEEVTYDLVIVNSGSKLKVYTLSPEAAEGLIVEVDPIVVVGAGSSETVKVTVRATESAKEGTHVVAVNVKSESELVEQVSFTANVEKGKAVSNSVFVLTIVLVIVFVVLLIILIVLLTRKPAVTEAEETSYY